MKYVYVCTPFKNLPPIVSKTKNRCQLALMKQLEEIGELIFNVDQDVCFYKTKEKEKVFTAEIITNKGKNREIEIIRCPIR